MLLEEILAKINELPEESRAEVLALAHKNKSVMRWAPNPGPQTEAFFSEADEIFYGGQAGGGKTDLAVGLSLTEHKRSLILRRINKDALKIVSRYEAILGHRDGYNGQLQRWRLGDRQIDIAGCEQEMRQAAVQGRSARPDRVR